MKQNKLSVVFLGTPLFSVPTLRSLINHPLCALKGVITQPDKPQGRGQKVQPPPIKKFCLENKIPCFQFTSLNTEEGLLCLKKLAPDLVIVVAFGQILSDKILNLPQYGCYNAHASLLPTYRGAAPINWALIHGEKETGVTIIKLVKKMDAGPILLQEKIPLDSSDNAQTLHDKLSHLSARLVTFSLEVLASVNDFAVSQKSFTDFTNPGTNATSPIQNLRPQIEKEATYAPLIHKNDCKINWKEPSLKVYNFIRGLSPQPCAFTFLNNSPLKVFASELTDQKSSNTPGTIQNYSQNGILISTKDTALLLTEIQLANKKRMTAHEFLKGYSLQKGTQLGI